MLSNKTISLCDSGAIGDTTDLVNFFNFHPVVLENNFNEEQLLYLKSLSNVVCKEDMIGIIRNFQ